MPASASASAAVCRHSGMFLSCPAILAIDSSRGNKQSVRDSGNTREAANVALATLNCLPNRLARTADRRNQTDAGNHYASVVQRTVPLKLVSPTRGSVINLIANKISSSCERIPRILVKQFESRAHLNRRSRHALHDFNCASTARIGLIEKLRDNGKSLEALRTAQQNTTDDFQFSFALRSTRSLEEQPHPARKRMPLKPAVVKRKGSASDIVAALLP